MNATAQYESDFPCDRSVLTVRKFLAGVAARARAESAAAARLAASPVEPVSAHASRTVWENFVPTTIQLATPLEAVSYVSEDVDGTKSPGFTTGIKVVDRVRQYPRARIQQVAVRTYLTLPARYSEIHARAAYLERSGYPLRLDACLFGSSQDVFAGLTTREYRRLDFIMPDEKVALAAVLVAATRPVVAFSANGLWPRHPLVLEVAARVGCTILRRRLDEIPLPVLRRIRCVRYVPVKEKS